MAAQRPRVAGANLWLHALPAALLAVVCGVALWIWAVPVGIRLWDNMPLARQHGPILGILAAVASLGIAGVVAWWHAHRRRTGPGSLRQAIAPALLWGSAAIVPNIGCGLATNLVQSRIDRARPLASQTMANHDLARTVGHALALACHTAAGETTDPSVRSMLDRQARILPEAWERFVKSDPPELHGATSPYANLLDQALTRYVKDQAASPGLSPEEWRRLMLMAFIKHGDSPSDMLPAGDPRWATIAQRLNGWFGRAFIGAAKAARADDPRAAEALDLAISAAMLRSGVASVEPMADAGDEDALRALAEVRGTVATLTIQADRLLAGQARLERAVRGDLGAVRDDLKRLEGKIDAIGKDIGDVKADVGEMKELLADFLESQKRPGVDPTTMPVPPDVLAAAHELVKSKDARERASAAIVLKLWDDARREIDALNASRAIEEVFQNKILEGDFYYAQGRFDDAIAPYEVAFNLRQSDLMARNGLAIALQQARLGDLSAKKKRAIEIHEGTLRLPGLSRADWAGTQNNLGNAWQSMPTGDLAQNLTRAIECYTEAIKEYTRDAAPMQWAGAQNNLGNAWLNMPTGDRAQNLTRAIACYTEALKEHTRAAAPMDWAMTQNNLGLAWRNMPTGDRAANLRTAIACYTEALKEYTRAVAPMQWAGAQNNLGNAWQSMPTGDLAQNLTRAIECYTEALKEWTRSDAPMEWAMTQNNLALALAELAEQPGQDQCRLLRQAIASGKAALLVRTPEAFPRGHEVTAKNLAIDRRRYEALGCGDGAGGAAFDAIEPAP